MIEPSFAEAARLFFDRSGLSGSRSFATTRGQPFSATFHVRELTTVSVQLDDEGDRLVGRVINEGGPRAPEPVEVMLSAGELEVSEHPQVAVQRVKERSKPRGLIAVSNTLIIRTSAFLQAVSPSPRPLPKGPKGEGARQVTS
jgi:hypothetical protein